MEKSAKFDSIQPRFLRYRSHYRVYLIVLLVFSGLILSFWGHRLTQENFNVILKENMLELCASGCYFLLFGCFHFFWLKNRLNQSVQVFESHVLLHKRGQIEEVKFEDVENVGVVCWSVFYFKMKNGNKHYFSSSLERVDYIWEGIHACRQDLIPAGEFESFRTKLVQYDHHQKRKEWFFRHKLVDMFNWFVLPAAFMGITFFVQSREVVVNQPGMYFFRLMMYAFLVLLFTTFCFSFVLKKFVFDKRIKLQMSSKPDDKLRDLEFEGIILQRSKMMQMITAAFFFSLVLRSEMNLFSLTKVKEDLTSFNLKQGNTLLVDNRYNCVVCKYPVRDGDIVVFGRGTIGQVMATQGDMVGQISQDTKGRIIASENIQEVPAGHVAIKLANQREIVMVKLHELIGKIQK